MDLTEYRRKLARAQGQPEAEEEEARRPVRARTVRRRSFRPGVMLDCAASVALIVTALTFAVKIL